ncbi:MAG: cytochrome-c oxidase, cbb3-type subunit III [Xanthomonadales bacterium]|nr:cytochrome-c oxidase, cbb3-type subunit III [Xanthomonadales bacterium]
MSNAWSWYVIAIVVLNVAGCVWLLWWTGKRRPGDPAPTDTSHVWDGDITEYNKPMPRWWIVLFYLTIIFSIGYLYWYPGFGNYAGSSGWTSVGELKAQQAEANQRLADTFSRFEGMPLDQMADDPDALRIGRSVFGNYCSTCHGSDARGARGFPNLADDIWHWGGSPQQIEQTVMNGRTAAMPPLAAAVGGEAGVTEVAVYVQSLSGQKVDPALAAAGKNRFAGICAACHGPEGKGNPALGAPDLTDSYWLYGSDFDSIREGIVNGRNGNMPAHGPILGKTRARMAAAYVYSLSHGKDGQAADAK